MHLQGGSRQKTVNVGVLGDNLVGKTVLWHWFVGKPYEQYNKTTEVCHHEAVQARGDVRFAYVDNPSLDSQAIIKLGSLHQYDILVFLFKDCESFTKLYQFLAQVREIIANCEDNHVKHYWKNLQKIFLVYTDFQSTLQVQLELLFPILKQEIGYFCNNAQVIQFYLKKETDNWRDLKNDIEKEYIFMDMKQVPSDKLSGLGNIQGSQHYKIQEHSNNNHIAANHEAQDHQIKNPSQQQITRQQAIDVQQQHEKKGGDQRQYKDAVIVQISPAQAQQMRRQSVYQKIRDSFNYSSSVGIEQKKSQVVEQLQIKQIVQAQKHNDNNLFQSFRHTKKQEDISLDKHIVQYNQSKKKKFQQQIQISQDEKIKDANTTNHPVKAEIKQQPKQQKKKVISSQARGKKQLNAPESNYLGGKKPRSDEVTSPSEKACACTIM